MLFMIDCKKSYATDKARKIIKVCSLLFLSIGLLAMRNLVEKLDFIREPGFLVACLIVLIFSLVMFALSFFLCFKPQWFIDHFREMLLLAASICLCLVLVETGLRLFYISIRRGTLENLHRYFPDPPQGDHVLLGAMIQPHADRRILYALRPNLDVFYKGARVTTNSAGWREGEYSKKKTKNTIRIVGIGDSFMFGHGVEEDTRYMDVLEHKLKKDFRHINWEVMVFAVLGYNLAMEVEVLKQEALDYDPDLIVYGFVENDVCLSAFLLRGGSFFAARPMIVDYLDPILSRNILLQGKTPSGKPFLEICHEREAPEEYKDLVGEKAFLKALEELADVGTLKDVPVVIFSKERLHPDHKIAHENIYYFDAETEMDEYLQFRKKSDLVISKRDGHPSATGHKIMAEALHRQLLDGRVIQDIIAKRRLETSSSTPFEPAIPK